MEKEPKTLKELITGFRECKTRADERSLILREKAIIQNSFKEKKHKPFLLRNMAKLIWINMLGYDTEFGQLECLNTLVNDSFALKKFGYVGLGVFFSEKSEILLLATHRIGEDLDNSNNYVVAIALTSFCEIADEGMCESLHSKIFPKIQFGQKYIRKKAMMASLRILMKKPVLVDEVLSYVGDMLEERNHGLLICSLRLAIEIVTIRPEARRKFIESSKKVIRYLKDISGQYNSEYDVDNVNDPFLQVYILQFLSIMSAEVQIKEDFSSLLATLTVNLPTRTSVGTGENIASNAVNCILYECVKIIMEMDSAKTLKKVGVNILSIFLGYKDVNSKYISLKMLISASKYYKKIVQKHLKQILDCLKEDELSLRKMTLEIIKQIADESNIKSITSQLFNDMLVCKKEYLENMTPKVCAIIEANAPTKSWYFASMLRVLVIAGNYVNDESINNLLNVVSNTIEIHSFAIYKLYLALCENQDQEGLAKALFWLAGEHSQVLLAGYDPHNSFTLPKVSETSLLNLIENILGNKVSSLTLQMGINCLAKLYNKVTSQESKRRISKIISDNKSSKMYEAQIRAVEYSVLLRDSWSELRAEVFKIMPAPDSEFISTNEKMIGTVNLEEIKNARILDVKLLTKEDRRREEDVEGNSIVDNSTQPDLPSLEEVTPIEDLLGGDIQEESQKDNISTNQDILDLADLTDGQKPHNQGDLLSDLQDLSSPHKANSTHSAPPQEDDLLDMFSGDIAQTKLPPVIESQVEFDLMNLHTQSSPIQAPSPTPVFDGGLDLLSLGGQPASSDLLINAFSSADLSIVLAYKAGSDEITAKFSSSAMSLISDIVLLVSVPGNLSLTLKPPQGSTLEPFAHNIPLQTMIVEGPRPAVLRFKVSYNLNGLKKEDVWTTEGIM